jgi:lipoprotein NlpI
MHWKFNERNPVGRCGRANGAAVTTLHDIIINNRSYTLLVAVFEYLYLAEKAMLKTSVILTGLLCLSALGTLEAHPQNSSDVVHIGGQSCHAACQSYMAWSHEIMPVPGQPHRVFLRARARQRPAKAVAGRVIVLEAGWRPATNPPVTKPAAPTSTEMSQANVADLQSARTTSASGTLGAKISEAQPAADSDGAGAKIADQSSSGACATDSHTRTTKELVTAATTLAERLTGAMAPSQGPSPSSDSNLRIAILVACPEIKSVSDLTGKSIAIDTGLSGSSDNVRRAIARAGAAEVQISEGEMKALDRLIGGEMPAAILTLASPEAAEAFPKIAGFNILQIPLTPERPQAKTTDLAAVANVAAASDAPEAKIADLRPSRTVITASQTRTTQELVTAATELAEQMTVATADHQRTASMPSNDTDPRTALIMARLEIKSISDLAGKEIAIDDKQSASSSDIRAAIGAAGAAEVQVSKAQTKAINRLFVAEVPAAVLTLVSPEAAEAFPEIAGFRIFRVPLSPRSTPLTKALAMNESSSASMSPTIKTSSRPIDPSPSDDLDRIIADLDQAIQRAPEDAKAYRDRGNAWGRKGDTDRALADYQQAIHINPKDPAIFHDRGLMWQRKGELDKAIVDFDRSVRMSFSDPAVYSDRGAAWFEKGSYDRALADFDHALKINPGLATAYVRRAAVFERKGDQERARADRERATRLGGPSLIQREVRD